MVMAGLPAGYQIAEETGFRPSLGMGCEKLEGATLLYIGEAPIRQNALSVTILASGAAILNARGERRVLRRGYKLTQISL